MSSATPSATAAHTFPCGQCGAQLTFSPGAQSLKCQYCGHEQTIAQDSVKPIVEYDLTEGLERLRRRPANELVRDGIEVRCKGCGATAVVADQAKSCAFCDAPVVVAPHGEQDEIVVPESLLPFGVEDRQVREMFRAWVKSLWFKPGDLTKRAQAQRVDGVYLPYWTYDSETTTHYTGMRGDHYYVTETYTDGEGKTQTRTVQKTRWSPASGIVRVEFDDLLICASRSLPRELVRKLEPWDLEALAPYDPAYLSGFVAERYGVELDEGFKLAEERMEPQIRSAICRDIGGDVQLVHGMSIQHDQTRFKHLLLPLWISSFRYADRVYRFICNARTGEIAGERPWSWPKIAAAVLAAIVVVVTIVLLSQR